MGRKSKIQLEKERKLMNVITKTNEYYDTYILYFENTKCNYSDTANMYLRASCITCKFAEQSEELQAVIDNYCDSDENFKTMFNSMQEDEFSQELYMAYFKQFDRYIILAELQAPPAIMEYEMFLREKAKYKYEDYIEEFFEQQGEKIVKLIK